MNSNPYYIHIDDATPADIARGADVYGYEFDVISDKVSVRTYPPSMRRAVGQLKRAFSMRIRSHRPAILDSDSVCCKDNGFCALTEITTTDFDLAATSDKYITVVKDSDPAHDQTPPRLPSAGVNLTPRLLTSPAHHWCAAGVSTFN